MRRRGISPVMIAGIIAILAALGLIYLISTGGVFTQIDPTAQQQTVDAIVRTRLTQTAEKKATATAEITEEIDPIWRTATEIRRLSDIYAGTPSPTGTLPTLEPLSSIFITTPEPTSTSENP